MSKAMKGPKISSDQVKTLLKTPFLNVVDLQYAPGRHYYNATRKAPDQLPALKSDDAFRAMLPDAVTCVVILRTPGIAPRLLLLREYRYPAGRFLLSPPAGLLDPEDLETDCPLLSAACREIAEETGITAAPARAEVINPLLFSSPGLTDESNGLVLAVYDLPDTDMLSQQGAVGSECFAGFRLLTRDEAEAFLRRGRDEEGNYYSVYTWAALSWFVGFESGD